MANKFSCQAAWKREEYVVTVQPVMIKLVHDVVKNTLNLLTGFGGGVSCGEDASVRRGSLKLGMLH